MLQLSFVRFRQGSYLFVEGRNDSVFYIIQSGKVRSVREDNLTSPDILGPGDFVGVISVFSGNLQIENAIAITDCVCIAVRKNQYPELIQQNTPVALKMIRTFAARMRVMNDKLMRLTLSKSNSDSGFEQMFDTAVYYDRKGLMNLAYFAYCQYIRSCPTGSHSEIAKIRFTALKSKCKAPYILPSADLVRSYPKDTMIMCENQRGAEMYIIQEGSVKISKIVNNEEITLAILKKGDMFGEMALLENKPRSATAIAHENCVLMTVNAKNFNQMVTTQAQMIARLTTSFAERLWSMCRQLSNAQLSDPVSKLVDMLALQIEKSKKTISKGDSFATNLAIQDLVNMCGIPHDLQASASYHFMQLGKIRIIDGKICVPDSLEIIKEAQFRRKQHLRNSAK